MPEPLTLQKACSPDSELTLEACARADVKETRREREFEENEKESFMFKASSFRDASHTTTKTSSIVIVKDYSGQCPVQY